MILEILGNYINDVLSKNDFKYTIHVILSNRKELCDYQIDDCFKLAKELHTSPLEIGNNIVSILKNDSLSNDYFSLVEAVAPGFVNLKLSDSFITSILKRMYENPKFNIKVPEKAETYFIDYGGPNVAKPLHVGHMRTAIVGESIKRIISYMGHKTIADVHLGDFGLQIGQVIYGIKKESRENSITIDYLEELYPRMSALCKEDDSIKEKCALITKELQEGNVEYRELWKKIMEVSVADIKRLYDYLDVHFDLWQGESDAYEYIPVCEEILENKGLLQDSEGAKIVDVSEDSDSSTVPPLIFKKSNGSYLYATTDVATIYEREMHYQPDHILYIVDNRQKMHFEQVFRTCRMANITDANLEFLGYGTVNGTDGKPFKTRKGDAPKLDSLFLQIKEIFRNVKESNETMNEEDSDKIVNSILKFADLQNNRDRDYIFDIEKFSNVVGKTGPYMLYTTLRIKKILKNEEFNHTLSNNVYNESDRNLRIKLLELDLAINSAFNYRMPSYIADYIYNLAILTNNFYQTNHINGLEDTNKKNDWLFVLNLTSMVLEEMLHLIVIDIPSFM